MVPVPTEKERRALRVRQNKVQGVSYEKRVLRKLGAKRVVMSGATSVKGDGRLYTPYGQVFIECKYQMKKGGRFVLRRDWLERAAEQAKAERIPFWMLVFRASYAVDDFVIFPYQEPYTSIVRLPVYAHYQHNHAVFVTLFYQTMLIPYTHPKYGTEGLVLLTFANDVTTYAIGVALSVVRFFKEQP